MSLTCLKCNDGKTYNKKQFEDHKRFYHRELGSIFKCKGAYFRITRTDSHPNNECICIGCGEIIKFIRGRYEKHREICKTPCTEKPGERNEGENENGPHKRGRDEDINEDNEDNHRAKRPRGIRIIIILYILY